MKPTEHKTVQARILKYAVAIGWTLVSREEAERRRGFDPDIFTATDAIGFSYGVTWNTVRRNIFKWKEGGHSCPPFNGNNGFAPPHSFFNPDAEINVTKNRLPHWQQGEAWVFVTWRLGDSLPRVKLDQWKEERSIWLSQDEYWDRLIRNERHFFKVAEYIRKNPVKAKLRGGRFVQWERERERGLSSPHPTEEKGGQECPPSDPGRLEAKVESFCFIPNILSFLKDYILFAEKDEELQKYIPRQHQTGGVEKVVERALDPVRTRGLVWNTQGSGKTFTMIISAQTLTR
jgi:hypothetical protein